MKKNEPKKYDCSDIEKKVQLYLDNGLSETDFHSFEDHLSYCLPCDKKVEFEKKLKELVKLKASEKTFPLSLTEDLKKIIQGH
ncbi:MAG: zf-HC2 domain-containing protein [Calditrichales bacterium]|nr:MAG: zf-HC2 domain-containing protein [Calditrichales bacterium]